MATPVYLLNVYYSDAKKQVLDLAKFQPAIRMVSNGDMSVIEFDQNQVGYLFTSNLNHQDLRNNLAELCAPKIHILIVQVQSFVATNISEAAVRWLLVHGVEIQR